MEILIAALMLKAVKKLDGNGNPRFTFLVQPILDAGYDLAELRQSVKKQGARFVQNGSKISVQSYNLRHDLTEILTKASAAV